MIKFATKLLKGSVIFVMKNLSKQAVIIDNFSSPYIHQAIIILKSYPPDQHDRIIMEAEAAVSKYFKDNALPSFEGYDPKKKISRLKTAVLLLSFALIGAVALLIIK